MENVTIGVNKNEVYAFLNEEEKSNIDLENYDFGFAVVKFDWLKKVVESTTDYETVEDFLAEYTTEDTEDFLFDAEKEDAIVQVFFEQK